MDLLHGHVNDKQSLRIGQIKWQAYLGISHGSPLCKGLKESTHFTAFLNDLLGVFYIVSLNTFYGEHQSVCPSVGPSIHSSYAIVPVHYTNGWILLKYWLIIN